MGLDSPVVCIAPVVLAMVVSTGKKEQSFRALYIQLLITRWLSDGILF